MWITFGFIFLKKCIISKKWSENNNLEHLYHLELLSSGFHLFFVLYTLKQFKMLLNNNVCKWNIFINIHLIKRRLDIALSSVFDMHFVLFVVWMCGEFLPSIPAVGILFRFSMTLVLSPYSLVLSLLDGMICIWTLEEGRLTGNACGWSVKGLGISLLSDTVEHHDFHFSWHNLRYYILKKYLCF